MSVASSGCVAIISGLDPGLTVKSNHLDDDSPERLAIVMVIWVVPIAPSSGSTTRYLRYPDPRMNTFSDLTRLVSDEDAEIVTGPAGR
jgi:hypothetical protein